MSETVLLEREGEVAALGEPVERWLGRRASAEVESAGLSRRELEVVRLLSVGRTNREIAQELFVTPKTVEVHLSNAYRKLDIRGRRELSNALAA